MVLTGLVVREAALDGAERLEVVLVLVRVGRRPRADRARRRGALAAAAVAAVRERRRGLISVEAVEVLADGADEGEVLVLLVVVVLVRGEAIAARRRGRRRGGEGGGGGPGEAGRDLRDRGVRVGPGQDAGAAQRVEVLLQVLVDVRVRVVRVEIHRRRGQLSDGGGGGGGGVYLGFSLSPRRGREGKLGVRRWRWRRLGLCDTHASRASAEAAAAVRGI